MQEPLRSLNYSMLTEAEKTIYRHLDRTASAFGSVVYVPRSELVGRYDVTNAYNAALIESKCGHLLRGGDGFTWRDEPSRVTIFLRYFFGPEQARQSDLILRREVNRICRECIESCETEYERELYIHDYLAETVTYTTETYVKDQSEYTAYGAVVEHRSVCMGIAIAARMLLNGVGVDCGCLYNDEHMWNVVRIDGKCYNLDITWDIREGPSSHVYFNMSDRMLLRDHDVQYGPVCDSEDLYWYRVNGLDLRSADEIVRIVREAVREGKGSITFRIPGMSQFEVDSAVREALAATSASGTLTKAAGQPVYSMVFGGKKGIFFRGRGPISVRGCDETETAHDVFGIEP